jgi:hypothetical protein
MPATPSLAQEDQLISSKQRAAALERVAGSLTFKRAARLREFLIYVGRKSVAGHPDEIHEQEIGKLVFGRPDSYDTSLDNIVRVNASELRKRLETYFATEGAEDQVIIEIPRGSYTPVFRRRNVASVQTVSDGTASPVQLPPAQSEADGKSSLLTAPSLPREREMSPVERSEGGRRVPLLLWAALLGLSIGCAWLGWQNHVLGDKFSFWKRQPTVKAFWSNFLDSDRYTDIVLADTTVALAQDIAKRPLSLKDYLAQNYGSLEQSPSLAPAEHKDMELVLSRNNGSVGDFKTAEHILALDPVSSKLRLQFAREYTSDSMKLDNVILIGGRKSNPWVDLFDGQLNFTVGYDPQSSRNFVVNKHPIDKEQTEYEGQTGPSLVFGYSVVAYLPNLTHTGDVLILEGTDSHATAAAGEFVTSEQSLAKLKQQFPNDPFPYFEVLLKTSNVTGTPFSSEIIALRTYPRR